MQHKTSHWKYFAPHQSTFFFYSIFIPEREPATSPRRLREAHQRLGFCDSKQLNNWVQNSQRNIVQMVQDCTLRCNETCESICIMERRIRYCSDTALDVQLSMHEGFIMIKVHEEFFYSKSYLMAYKVANGHKIPHIKPVACFRLIKLKHDQKQFSSYKHSSNKTRLRRVWSELASHVECILKLQRWDTLTKGYESVEDDVHTFFKAILLR